MTKPRKRKIDPKLIDKIEAELLAGEKLLWTGQPSVGRMLRLPSRKGSATLNGIVGFMILVLFVLFFSAGLTAAPNLAPTLLTLLALIGLSVLGPLFLKYRQATQTLYAITDRRAIIMDGKDITSYRDKDLQFIERNLTGDNRGDLIFRREKHRQIAAGFFVSSMRDVTLKEGFMGIPYVREVEALMLETFGTDVRDYTDDDEAAHRRLEVDADSSSDDDLAVTDSMLHERESAR